MIAFNGRQPHLIGIEMYGALYKLIHTDMHSYIVIINFWFGLNIAFKQGIVFNVRQPHNMRVELSGYGKCRTVTNPPGE